MALQVQSLSQPFASTQSYLVTGTTGDTVTAATSDRTIATVSPLSAVLTSTGFIFTAQRGTTSGGACTVTFTDTNTTEQIPITVNVSGDPGCDPSPIAGTIGDVITVTVSEENDPNAFASITSGDITIATVSITSNSSGVAVVAVTLVKNGVTTLNIDDGHGGTLSVDILVGASSPRRNVTLSAIEAVVGGQLVKTAKSVVTLQDATSGYNGSGNYTISLKNNAAYVVTYGIPPAESTTQINVASAVVRPDGTVYISDGRTLQVTAQAVNSTIMAESGADGSFLSAGSVTERTLGADVIALLNTVPSGSQEPANPHNGQTFYNTTTNVYEVYENGTWVTLSNVSTTGKRACQVVLCSSDFTPGSTGADAVAIKVPVDPISGNTVWTVGEIFLRTETTAASGTSSVKIQRSTGVGVFTNAGYLNTTSVDVAAGAYETSMTSAFTVSTVNAGDKLRAEFTALGTGAAGFSCYVLLKEI